jgi:hypothetical protein
MLRSGQRVASQRVGSDEWRIAFGSIAGEHIWQFEAYKTGEKPSGKPNVFWSERRQRFMAPSRLDVPPTLLERTVAWIAHVAGRPP